MHEIRVARLLVRELHNPDVGEFIGEFLRRGNRAPRDALRFLALTLWRRELCFHLLDRSRLGVGFELEVNDMVNGTVRGDGAHGEKGEGGENGFHRRAVSELPSVMQAWSSGT